MKCAAFIGDAGTNMRHEKAPQFALSIDSRAIQDNHRAAHWPR